MVEIVTGEFSKYRSNLLDAQGDMKAWLWDCGPEEPGLPEPPSAPQGREGDPKYDLAKVQFRRALKAYEEQLLLYEQRAAEFKDWNIRMGGPMERLFYSCDARDALFYDKRAVEEGRQTHRRYYVSHRNSRNVIAMLQRFGHEALKENGGLPAKLKPGRGHQEEIERQIAGEKEFVAALRADPQFGQEMRA